MLYIRGYNMLVMCVRSLTFMPWIIHSLSHRHDSEQLLHLYYFPSPTFPSLPITLLLSPMHVCHLVDAIVHDIPPNLALYSISTPFQVDCPPFMARILKKIKSFTTDYSTQRCTKLYISLMCISIYLINVELNRHWLSTKHLFLNISLVFTWH